MKSNEKKKGRKKAVLWLAVVLAAAAGVGFFFFTEQAQEVELAAVIRMDLHQGIKEMATVESDTTVTVSARLGGEVTSVRVTEGQQVAAGALLLTIDQKTDYQKAAAQQLDVQSLRAQAAGIEQQLATAVEQAEKNAHLYEQGVISYEDYNQSENAVRKLESELSSLDYSIQGASAAVITESGDVKAPVSGAITMVGIKTGEIAAAGSPLFEISDLDHIHIRADLIAEDAAGVVEGQRVILYGSGKDPLPVEGIVRKIDVKAQEKVSELGIAQKRVGVEIALVSGYRLILGSDLDVEIVTAEREQVVCVPEKAIFQMNQRDWVYVAEAERAVLRQVEKGLEGDRYAEILSGLEEGEAVILSPASDITDGTKIKEKQQ